MNKFENAVYPELADVVQDFVAEVQATLGSNFLGTYLVGSLATGNFDLDSDVDFLVITKAEISDTDVKSLEAAHRRIHALGSYPAKHLEGSYLSAELLNRADAVGVEPVWYVDNGSTTLERSVHDNKWHVRWILRERSVVVAGPDPKTIMREISPAAVRGEALASMQDLRRRFADELDRPLGWFNTRFGQSFAVLTFCRMLQTIVTGRVESKLAAVKWAEEFVDPEWRELIRAAWVEREGVRFGDKVRQPADARVMHESARFLDYAVRRAETCRPVGNS
jgi:hypothetical protein